MASGHLQRSVAMCQRYTSFHSSLADTHGVDFQVLDQHHKLKIQCQANSHDPMGYNLTFSAEDFDYSLQGSVNETGTRSFRLPRRLVDRQSWDYQILLFK